MPATILTDARVGALKSRKTVRDFRDVKLRGFGVRVSPSGRKQFFIQCQHRGERTWRIVGDAESMNVTGNRSTLGGCARCQAGLNDRKVAASLGTASFQ